MPTGRKIAFLLPTDRTQRRLEGVAKRFGLNIGRDFDGRPVTHFEFHMTLLYSVEDNLDYPNVTMPLGHILNVNGAVITTLGNAVVLKTTKNPKLLQVRDNLMKNIGGTSPYDGFIPHVSLSYDPVDIDRFEEPVPFWYKRLQFDRIVVKNSDSS